SPGTGVGGRRTDALRVDHGPERPGRPRTPRRARPADPAAGQRPGPHRPGPRPRLHRAAHAAVGGVRGRARRPREGRARWARPGTRTGRRHAWGRDAALDDGMDNSVNDGTAATGAP